MNPTEQQLIAYADGELPMDEMREVEAALKERPDLQAFVARQHALRKHIEGAFAPYLVEDVPDRLREALMRSPVSWRWRLRQVFADAGTRRPLLWSGFAAGAALACGVLVGVAITPQDAFRIDRGELMARGELSNSLDYQLASAQGANVRVRVGLSFKARDGRFCRTFERAEEASSLAGVACRDAQGWAIAALAAAPANGSPYRMAGAMPDTIRHAVQGMIAGEPLDADAEKRARDAGWR